MQAARKSRGRGFAHVSFEWQTFSVVSKLNSMKLFIDIEIK